MNPEREKEIRQYCSAAIKLDSNSNQRYQVEELLIEIDRMRNILIECLPRLDDGDNSDELYCKINEVLGGGK
jgi:ornithine carbamoyltransferase